MTASPVDHPHWLGGLGALVVTAALGVAAGPWGVAVGLATALAWYLLPAAYAFALGQLLVVAALPSTGPLAPDVTAIAAEFGLLLVLAGPLGTTDESLLVVTMLGVGTVTLVAVGWGVLRAGRPLWLSVLAVAIVATTAAYVLHRYERVRLGLVTEEATTDGPAEVP